MRIPGELTNRMVSGSASKMSKGVQAINPNTHPHRVSGFCGIIAKHADRYYESVLLSHCYGRLLSQWLQPTGTSL